MSKYKVLITSKAHKDYKKLDPSVKKRITNAILKLQRNRTPQQFKPIMGKDISQFRFRIGDYRVLYDVHDEEKEVLILRIGHRKDIYK